MDAIGADLDAFYAASGIRAKRSVRPSMCTRGCRSDGDRSEQGARRAPLRVVMSPVSLSARGASDRSMVAASRAHSMRPYGYTMEQLIYDARWLSDSDGSFSFAGSTRSALEHGFFLSSE